MSSLSYFTNASNLAPRFFFHETKAINSECNAFENHYFWVLAEVGDVKRVCRSKYLLIGNFFDMLLKLLTTYVYLSYNLFNL